MSLHKNETGEHGYETPCHPHGPVKGFVKYQVQALCIFPSVGVTIMPTVVYYKKVPAMPGGINESQFCMWRAILAFANADDKVTGEEVEFVAKAMEIVPFTKEQLKIIKKDIRNPPDIVQMFENIKEQEDKSDFFHYARMLAWCDGEFDHKEQNILTSLQRRHMKNADIERMLQNAEFSFEDEEQRNRALKEYEELTEKGRLGILKSLAQKYRNI